MPGMPSIPGLSSGGGDMDLSTSSEAKTGAVTTGGISFGAEENSTVEMVRMAVIAVVALVALKMFKG